MVPADAPLDGRCALLADDVSQLLYLKDALLSDDRRALRRAILVLSAGPGRAALLAGIDAALARVADS
jgi:hypothetical protein